jgi:hypothetical protein
MKAKAGTESIPGIINLLRALKTEQVNDICGIFLDETLREFFCLNTPVVIPAIPVSSIKHNNAADILNVISRVIPAFMAGHSYLEKRNPVSEEHSIHLACRARGKAVDFIHMLRLDFKFSSNSGTIVKKGDSNTFPSYSTERIYFKSRLVPVCRGGTADGFESVKLRESVRVEAGTSDRRLFTSVLFDDFSSREISTELSRKPGDIFKVPVTIYPMLVYDYFTACLNVPGLEYGGLAEAAAVFEPLFISLFSDVRGCDHSLVIEGLEAWPDCISSSDGGVFLKPEFTRILKSYFSRYSLFTDDDLLLRGWKKIIFG